MKNRFGLRMAVTLAISLVMFVAATSAFAQAWRFGVMSDTQWTGVNDDGRNPTLVATDIIHQINQQMIANEVAFVIQVGDLTENGSKTTFNVNKTIGGVTTSYSAAGLQSEDIRAIMAQELYNHRIGFFPVRGNHDDSAAAAVEFKRIYPQTQDGRNNNTPADAFNVANPDSGTYALPVKTYPAIFGRGFHFSSPAIANSALSGLTYSFDLNNARFVLLDQFTHADGTGTGTSNVNSNFIQQLGWINSTLADRPAGSHAFVFTHKNFINGQHTDVFTGANPSSNAAQTNTLFKSFQDNNVRFAFGGHDHMHVHSIINSPDETTNTLHEVVCASDSSKFYVPLGDLTYRSPNTGPNKTNDGLYDAQRRETPVAQELYTVGYYIVTVDGPIAKIEYYSADNTEADIDPVAIEGWIPTTPALHFTKKDTMGYSLNGKEFLVRQGDSYTSVHDTFGTTTASIIGGTNGSTEADSSGRHFTKAVETGWTPSNAKQTASDVLTLIGMSDIGTDQTDSYALSMTYNASSNMVQKTLLKAGKAGIAVQDGSGKWVNAVSMNFGGSKNFVRGPWDPSYSLGTYGYDSSTKTVWAVLNYNADFAVTKFSK